MENNFWHYLKTNLTAHEYENLAEAIGCGPKRLTRMENGTTDFLLEEIIELAKLLNRHPTDLIMEYGIGKKNISLEDMDALLAGEGMELGIIAHAA